MKIISVCLMAIALLTGGCAHSPSGGGTAEQGLSGWSQAAVTTPDASGAQDYREILADPGPF